MGAWHSAFERIFLDDSDSDIPRLHFGICALLDFFSPGPESGYVCPSGKNSEMVEVELQLLVADSVMRVQRKHIEV